ncbi:Lsr2 family protein [Curtobacterium sp. ME12]|uniref:histone-like nucleoid-structuring protein Lsr2 n=1 Tax=Curtobacterium sp. ME12 TaxID=2744253 RepID=UPI00286FFC12|nr:Lsr2 family protein [Curtobacterium sp. ME12]
MRIAQKVTTHLDDDSTGDTIDEGKGRTVSFSFDGNHYEIDLSGDNADALHEAFSDYVAAARKVNGRQTRKNLGSAPKRGNSDELAKIREWANSNGHEVSGRGRISRAIRDAYDAAHSPDSPSPTKVGYPRGQPAFVA